MWFLATGNNMQFSLLRLYLSSVQNDEEIPDKNHHIAKSNRFDDSIKQINKNTDNTRSNHTDSVDVVGP